MAKKDDYSDIKESEKVEAQVRTIHEECKQQLRLAGGVFGDRHLEIR